MFLNILCPIKERLGSPSPIELLNLALDVGPEWKSLGHVLGFQLSEMESIESRGEGCFSMLMQWFNAVKEPPSFEVISKMLSHSEVRRDDLAYKHCTG